MNPEKPSIWHYLGVGGGATPTDLKNNKQLSLLSIAWALTVVAASALLVTLDLAPPLQWLLVLAPSVVAYFVLRAYLRFLRMTDEMQRRIQIEGLAVGFGVGFAFANAYLVAEAAGAPPLNLAILILVMTIGWGSGNFFAVKRYQ
jgi:O-antigen/teichoic acid export membrane protein